MNIRTLGLAAFSVVVILICSPQLSADPIVVVYGIDGTVVIPAGFASFNNYDDNLDPLAETAIFTAPNRTARVDSNITFVSASQGSAQLSADFSNPEEAGNIALDNAWYYEFTATEDGLFKLAYSSTRVQPVVFAVVNRVEGTTINYATGNYQQNTAEMTSPPPTTVTLGIPPWTPADFSATTYAQQTLTTHVAGSGTLETDWTVTSTDVRLQTSVDAQYKFIAQEDGNYTLNYSDTGSAPTAGTADYYFLFAAGGINSPNLQFAPGDSGTAVRSFNAGDIVDAHLILNTAITGATGSFDSNATFDFSITVAGNPVAIGEYTIQFTGQSDVLFDPGDSGNVSFPVTAGNTYTVRATFDGDRSGPAQFGSVGTFDFEIVPEPVTLFVMTAAGLPMLLRRRRRS